MKGPTPGAGDGSARSRAARSQGRDPGELLIARTGRRLAVYTLVLVAALMVAVGVVTAIAATRLMHETIDRALEDAVAAVGRSGDEPGEQRVSATGDTFMVLLDRNGALLPGETAPLEGVPDLGAVDSAAHTGQDLRDASLGGVNVRLLTRAVTLPATDEVPVVKGFAQAGYRLTLHDRQEGQLLWTIAIMSGLGILGAALVTVLVTRRALVPVRNAFATERRFVAAASHELRTPVAIVRASAEILQREALVTDEGRPLVEDIVAEADRMGLLVTDLLTLASAEAGALQLDRRPLDLIAWLGGFARRAESMAGEAGLLVRTELPDEPSLIVEADESRLAQLMLILVDNAVQHSPGGGTITLELARAGGRATLAVRDQGPGIPTSERERIFEPFARLPGRRRNGSGSGLGLAIARQLASRHGAEIGVEDAPGGGARFTIRLSIAPPPVLAGLAATDGRG